MNTDSLKTRLPSGPFAAEAYANPWQARAMALAIALNEAGHLDWQEWTRLLGEEIAKSPATSAADTDDGEAYYLCCIAALEKAAAGMAPPKP